MAKAVFLGLLLSLMACTSFGQVNKPTWTLNWEFFTAKGSTVEVRVRAMARTSNQPQEYYSLQVVCRATCPELTEEVGFLQVVTHDMEDRNVPPERLAIILLDLCGPDVSKYLSIDAYNSNAWIGAAPRDYGKLTVELLNAIGAYDPLNRVFERYGLSWRVGHAEHVVTAKQQEIGLPPNKVSQLPSGATLEIALYHADKKT